MALPNPRRFVDLFCGRGFRLAAQMACQHYNLIPASVFSCGIDLDAQKTYQANFSEYPAGDITKINISAPHHDLLFVRFPYQVGR